MTVLARVFVEWSGWEGGPGVNVLHYSPGTTTDWTEEVVEGLVEEVETAYVVMKQIWQSSIFATVMPTVRLIDSDSGALVGIVLSPTAPAPIAGTGTGSKLSATTMLATRFLTNDFIRGRQLRGRAFIGPLASNAIDTEMNIESTVPSIIADAFAASISGVGPRLAVWSRPPGGGSSGGSYGDVVTVSAMPQPAVLKSRRD